MDTIIAFLQQPIGLALVAFLVALVDWLLELAPIKSNNLVTLLLNGVKSLLGLIKKPQQP